MHMALPIGYDNFGKIREFGLDFVDKSLFIKNILEDQTYVNRITGPAGTSFFGNATSCLHRAGDLESNHTRDAITFTIDPSDEPIKENWIDKVKPHPSESSKYIASKEN